MKQRSVSKNTKLLSNGNFENISFRLLTEFLVNINKDYEKKPFNFF